MTTNTASDSAVNIFINIKTPKEIKKVELISNASIKEFRAKVAEAFSITDLEKVCLIFSGKILKDEDSLNVLGIKDGLTVHMIIRQPTSNPAATTPVAQSNSQPVSSQIPASTRPAGGIDVAGGGNLLDMFSGGGTGGLDFGAALGGLAGGGGLNFADMQRQMQNEIAANPDMMRQMLDNPMVQQLFSNPEIMRQMIQSNPQMRELMERNPEVGQMLNNPQTLRQSLEFARNPAALQEMMRNYDRAVSNLESIPGGFNHLQRIYRDVQEPLMDAVDPSRTNNPFASLAATSTGTGSTQQGHENSEPLPNPWAAPSSGGTPASVGGIRQQGGNFGGLVINPPGNNSAAATNPLLGQLATNPNAIMQAMQSPVMQTMMQNLLQNPQLAENLLLNSPMSGIALGNNPTERAERMRSVLPQLLQNMQRPEMQAMFQNPRAVQAMMQVQSGLAILQQEVPGLFTGTDGFPGFMLPTTVPANTTNPTEIPTNPAASVTTPTTGNTTNSAAGAPSPDLIALLTSMMSQQGGSGAGGSLPSNTGGLSGAGGPNLLSGLLGGTAAVQAPPEVRFRDQLEQLSAMGFPNREANIRALTQTFGDVNEAIDRLLEERRRGAI